MQQQSIYRTFLHYLFPSAASMVGLSCYILADTYFISVGIGGIGLAALNLVLPVYSLISATGLMLGIGAGVVVSVSRGVGDQHRADRAFTCAVTAGLVAGIVFTVIGVGFTRPLCVLLGASEQALPYAVEYLRTLCRFSVFFLLNSILTALVRNDGNPRLAMAAMLTGSLTNIVLDYVFIIRFGWGMFGASFATGFAPVLGIAILSSHWLRRRNSIRLRKERFSPALLGSLLRNGSSNFIIELGGGVIILLFNITLLGIGGDLAVAAYGIVANIALVISNLFVGIGQGLQPVASKCHGEGDHVATRRLLAVALWIAVAVGILCCAVGQLLPQQLTAIFNSEGNAQLAGITTRAIRIYFTAFVFMGFNICCASWMQAVLYSKSASAVSILRSFALVALGIAVLPRLFGLDGVWLTVPATEALTLLVCGTMLLTRRKPAQAAAPEKNPA